MKYWKATLAISTALSVSIALAEDFKTITGKEYKNAKVSRVEPDGIVLIYKSGVAKVYFADLPKEVQQRFGYDADKIETEKAAARAAQEKRIDEQKAAERESAEKEKNVEADLKRSVEKFQAAEQRASQMYGSAQKGTLSGQVFVSTSGGENRKLGTVEVALFARDAIDILLAGLKICADFKIQELSPSVDAAKAVMEQADASKEVALGKLGNEEWLQALETASHAYHEYQRILRDRDSYYSGSFYFSYLRSPISTVETDAEGKFIINVPKQGSFVIAAKAQRYVGKTYVGEIGIDITEHY